MGELKPGWKRVTLGQVAINSTAATKDYEADGYSRYIIGKHIPEDGRVTTWSPVGDAEFGSRIRTMVRAGDVICTTRGPKLKVAVADFDCLSAHTNFILRPKDARQFLPGILEAVVRSDGFQDHLRKHFRGSTNLFVNWSDAAQYEFALPPLEEQRRIAGLLAAASTHVDSLRRLASQAEQAEQASIVDLLMLRGFRPTDGRAPSAPPHWFVRKGQEVLTAESGNGEPACDEGASHLFFKVADFNRNTDERALDFAESRFDTGDTQNNERIRLFPEGTVIFPKRGASIFLNKVGVLGKKAALDPNLMAITSKHGSLRQRYLYWFCKGVGLWRLAETTSVPQLNHKHLYAAHILLPPATDQELLCNQLDQMRSASIRISERLTEARARSSALLKECGL